MKLSSKADNYFFWLHFFMGVCRAGFAVLARLRSASITLSACSIRWAALHFCFVSSPCGRFRPLASPPCFSAYWSFLPGGRSARAVGSAFGGAPVVFVFRISIVFRPCGVFSFFKFLSSFGRVGFCFVFRGSGLGAPSRCCAVPLPASAGIFLWGFAPMPPLRQLVFLSLGGRGWGRPPAATPSP